MRILAVGADRAGITGLHRAAAAGIPTFVCRVEDHPTRAEWDTALAERIAGHRPAFVVSAGFMKILGPRVLAPTPCSTRTRLCCPPTRRPRRAGRARRRGPGDRLHGARRRRGRGTGPVLAQAQVDVLPGDTEESLHERIKSVEHPCSSTSWAAWPARESPSSMGRPASRDRAVHHSRRAPPHPSGPRLRLRQDRARGARPRAPRGRRGAGLDRRVGAAHRGPRIPVTEVADLTGFPECLEGRVKTLHPRVHAGSSPTPARTTTWRQLAELGIEPFELVVCNLYPFRETVASGAGPDEVVEQIDIGGPSMVRAAAKNHPSVAVVVDPAAYPAVRGGGRG